MNEPPPDSNSERARPANDRLERWKPPAGLTIPTTVDWLALHDDAEGFRIIVQERKPDRSPGRRLRISFARPHAYRVADEGKRFGMLAQLARVGPAVVYIVENSTFLAWADAEAGGSLPFQSSIRHYLITTTDDCIDVLASQPPTFEWLDPE